MLERKPPPYTEDEIWADYPANLEVMPGEIHIDGSIIDKKSTLKKKAKAYIQDHREILKSAIENGQDIVAATYSHGTKFWIGAGLVGVALGAITYGIYSHKHHKPREK